ncbi:MAG: hypothetical protein LBI20_01585 [Holosporales bacterium]|nr:hypothetical protein [Holosporales bacterium]
MRRPAPPPDPVRRPSPPIRAERRAPPPAGEPQGRDFYIRDASDISRVLTQWGQDHDKDLAIITELARALWGSRVSWEEFTDLIIEIGPRLPATSHNRIAQEGYHILASVQIKLGKTVTSSLEQDSALQIAVFMHSLTGQDISIQHMNKLKALYAHSTLTIMTWIQGIVSQAISLCQPFQATAEARVQRLEQYLEVLLNRKIKYEIEKLFTEQRGFDRLIPESVLNKTRQLTDLSFYTRGLHYKHLAHLGFIQITTPDLFPIRGAQILEALGRKGVRTQVALPALAQQLRTCEEIYIASVGRANMGLSPPEPAIALRIPPPDQEQIRVINQELEHLSQVPRLMEAIFSTDFERGGPTPAEAHMLSDLSQRHNVAFNIAVAKCWLGQLTTDWLKQSRKFVGVTPEDVWSWDLSKSHPRLAKEILHLPPQTE